MRLSGVLLVAVLLSTCSQRPLVVGIAEVRSGGNVNVGRSYAEALIRGGHVPVIIPDIEDEERLKDALKRVDMLILPGGEDVAPARYGAEPSPQLGEVNEARDAFEFRILQEAVSQRKPILGICRGMQMLNVFLGGTLYQDLPSEYPDTSLHHRAGGNAQNPAHRIVVEKASRLHGIMGEDTMGVNSFHHQAVKRPGRGLRISARATDGVVEAFECDSLPIAGVQFHPEKMAASGDERWITLFRNIKKFCKR